MKLHLVKLCVGVDSLEDMQAWCSTRLARMSEAGEEPQLFHITRMTPKRADELLNGGSLYWVIKGQIQARQQLVDIVRFTDDEGVGRCKLVLGSDLIATRLIPKRAFQGWRYLVDAEAPDDLASGGSGLPAELRRELSELGLL